MKNTCGIAFFAILCLSGCNQGTPGGPGATGTSPTFGNANDTFHLSLPLVPSSLQQGQQTQVLVSIERAKNFEEDVAIKLGELPSGVTLLPLSPMIKHGDTNVALTLNASDSAPLGDFKIKVTGHPTKGSDAHVDLKIGIHARSGFSLDTPERTTSLKQGEMKIVSIGIQRDRGFSLDVPLHFTDMPLGVTLEPIAPIIKDGESNAQVMLNTSAEAALGDFSVEVSGSSASGAKSSKKFNLTVSKD